MVEDPVYFDYKGELLGPTWYNKGWCITRNQGQYMVYVPTEEGIMYFDTFEAAAMFAAIKGEL